MAEFDHGAKLLARIAGRELARVAGVDCQRWSPIESTIQVTAERLADRAFRARQGRERFVVYMEFCTYWSKDVPWDLMLKAAMLSQREYLPTIAVVYILRPKGYKPQQGTFQLSAAGSPTQQIWYREVPMWEQVPEPWWEDVPGLMALLPLCQHGRPPRDAVAQAVGAIEKQMKPGTGRADLLTTLSIFGKLAYPRIDVPGLIGREKMKESKFYQEILEEGRVEQARLAILRVLEARFHTPPPVDLARTLESIDDTAELGRYLQIAAVCANTNEFQASLPSAAQNA